MRGLSLIEVLIYMTLLSMLMTGVFETLELLYGQLVHTENQAFQLEATAAAEEASTSHE